MTMEYRKCFIPTCKNDSVNTPGKTFVRIKEDLREKWCGLAEVEYFKFYTQFCCEDHFDPREDLQNYYRHKLINEEPKLKSTALLRISTADTSTDSPEVCKLLVPQPTTLTHMKRKYDNTLNAPSTSACSNLPMKQSHTAILTDSEKYGIQIKKDAVDLKYVMGFSKKTKLSDKAVPSKFDCQKDRPYSSTSTVGSSQEIEVAECFQSQEEECATENLAEDDLSDVKSEPIDEQNEETSEQNFDVDLEDIKIEVEEHTIHSQLDKDLPVFIPCTRQTLPKINMFSITEYILHNDSYKNIDYKKLKTDIDINAEDTIGYVQLHKMADLITLQATVAFDKNTAHDCIVKYDLYTKTIDFTNCQCQLPACHHILAFLMWLHRRSEEQLDNDMSFNLEPLVQQTNFLMAKDLVSDTDSDSRTDSLPDDFDVSGNNTLVERDIPDDIDVPDNKVKTNKIQRDIVQEFLQKCKDLKMYNSPLYRYLNGNEQLEVSIHHMAVSWSERSQPERVGTGVASLDTFRKYCSKIMAQRDTVLQDLVTYNDKELRRELQYGRLDGQHLFDISSLKTDSGQTSNEEIEILKYAIVNPDIQPQDEYIEQMKTTLEKQINTNISECGIILCKEYPIFCGVPYGITDTHVLDIVCIDDEQITDFIKDNTLKPHIQLKLQLNMLLSKKEKSYFFIGFKKDDQIKKVFIIKSDFDKNYCKDFIEKGIRFWDDHVFKMISQDQST